MTLKDAERMLNIDYAVNKISSASESTNYFIFNVVPVETTDTRSTPIVPARAINKSTGRIVAFNPMMLDHAELKSIRRVR